MHFLYGILFLLITMVILTLYAIAAYLFVAWIQRVTFHFKKKFADEGARPPKMNLWPYYSKKAYLRVAILVCAVLVTVYIHQRIEWTGKGSAHPIAREYFVSGQVLAIIRIAGTYVLHPENMLLQPYNGLQRVIYEKGIRYLPKDDGEIGVWTDMWLLYPYSRGMTLPKVSINDPEATKHTHFVAGVFQAQQMFPRIISVLDRSWFAIETMSTKPFADKKMKRQYYLNFVRATTYYHIYDGFYAGKYLDSSKKMYGDSLHNRRRALLLEWVEALKDRWEAEGFYRTVWDQYPKVEAGRQILRLSILQQFWQVLAIRGEFRCDHPLIGKLHESYTNLMSGDYSKNALLHYSKWNMREASTVYEQNVYGSRGTEGQYLLTAVCHRKLPEEKGILITKKRADYRWYLSSIKSHVEEKLNANKGGK